MSARGTAPASTASAERAEAERRLLAWMREEPTLDDDARFAAIAELLFRHQFAHCAPYRRFCEGREKTPASVAHWSEIPAVPTGAFKELALRSFPAAAERHVFRTSGSSTARRGALHLDTLAVYEASLQPSFEACVLPDLPGDTPVRFLFLAPSPAEAPDSSLSHMFGTLLRRRGDADGAFLVMDGKLDLDTALAALDRCDGEGAPLALCGTAFGFVHLLEGLEERDRMLSLPTGTRAMETGGFKGRSRTRTRDELYAGIAERLGIAPERVVNQYGMTELGSQFHDSVLARPREPRRKLRPPWTRVRIVDPETGADTAGEEPGMIVIHDLANTGAVCTVQTADLGVRRGDGFEVLGRAPGAEERGCSIALDEMLGG